ncbi:MAG: cellulase family glycosylhydrolase [Candidatus Saccharimonas sp.]
MSALRGVNLGGWLVLERWMTPALFEGTNAEDEYMWMQTPGAVTTVDTHRKEFIQEADFRWIATHGIDVIRIPVGYWVLVGDGPYVEAASYLDWAMDMAAKHKLRVLLCLHGAPGSQNGYDHSGHKGKAAWYSDVAYRSRTVDTLVQLAKRYKDHTALWGIELLNEPRIKLFQGTLRRFYRDAYRALVTILPQSVHIVFHDAFTPHLLSGAIRARGSSVMMDIHWYHFTYWAFRWTPLSLYYKFILPWHQRTIQSLARRQPIIVGEWSGVIAGEVLNKYDVSLHDEMCRDNIRRQLAVYEKATAWFYWTYKTQDPGIWNYRSLVETDPSTFE